MEGPVVTTTLVSSVNYVSSFWRSVIPLALLISGWMTPQSDAISPNYILAAIERDFSSCFLDYDSVYRFFF